MEHINLIKNRLRNIYSLSCLIAFIFITSNSYSQKNPDLAKSPPMGWNSWNWHGKKDINEQVIRETIDAIVSEGLRDAGYVYVVIDGGWRDNKLGPGGELQPHPIKFPNGIKPLADYAHAKGLKLGLHIVPGTNDCLGDPVGSYGHEDVHIGQLIAWGIDFVKLDLCRHSGDTCTKCEKNELGWSENLIFNTYTRWSRLLHNCDRNILFSVSTYKFREWNPEYCNISRTTDDIRCRVYGSWENKYYGASFDEKDNPGSVMAIAEINNQSAKYAGNGYWNDPDMMVTGEQGLSINEQKAHFALWCIMSSPLILGNDPRFMTQDEREIILNREAIGVDQDPNEQGFRIYKSGDAEIWKKRLQNGNVAVLLLNRNPSKKIDIKLDFQDIGFTGKVNVRDIFLHKDAGHYKNFIARKTDPHSCSFLIISDN
jgi:alpha-galactosidase